MLPQVLAKFREKFQTLIPATERDLAQTSAILKQPMPQGAAHYQKEHRDSQLHPILQSILYPREFRPDATYLSLKGRES